MKIEHLTLCGNRVIRDSDDIYLSTRKTLKDFRIAYDSVVLNIPETELKVKITATHQGALFDVMKGENLAFLNACCFTKEMRKIILSQVKKIALKIPFLPDIVPDPQLDKFLYTVPIMPFALSTEEMMIAGEVEMYIYHQLYLEWKKQTFNP